MIKLMRINFEVWLFEAKTACEYPRRTFYRNGINSSEFWQDMYDIYLDLLKTFESYQKCFGVLALFHIFDSFVHTLLFVDVTISYFKAWSHFKQLFFLTFALLWIFKNIVIIGKLSFESEKMYLVLRDIRTFCVRIVGMKNCKNSLNTCKNINRVNNAAFSKFHANGWFKIDATLPMRVLAYITTYALVLLQFSFV
ncbi:hypothetical protein ABMA27_009242 [Loxostege sticticalis]|uniref:Uncharacterized protein n=1 Tax=Loxostege sticticalis TaxID=481309 RepID=A0ABR3HAL4_LOXSC